MRRWRRLRCAGRWRIRFQKTALFRVIVDGDGGCGGGECFFRGRKFMREGYYQIGVKRKKEYEDADGRKSVVVLGADSIIGTRL